MLNQPLNSNDFAKILIFSILLLPSVLAGFGVIPTIFLTFGIFMMKKAKDFSHIETAVKNFKAYCYLALFITVLGALYWGYDYVSDKSQYSYMYYGENALIWLAWACVPIVYILLVNKFFMEPLSDHREWLEVNGFFQSKKPFEPSKKETGVDIIKGERLKSYSVADELLKWTKLKEGGHISQDEYDEARNKLLKNN